VLAEGTVSRRAATHCEDATDRPGRFGTQPGAGCCHLFSLPPRFQVAGVASRADLWPSLARSATPTLDMQPTGTISVPAEEDGEE
jgi:hypothetical protein